MDNKTTIVAALKNLAAAVVTATVTFAVSSIVDKTVKSTIDKMEDELKPKRRFCIFR